jgi:hypothetical protein
MKWFDKQLIDFENARFGAMTLMITLQSCLGSIAAMFSLMTNNFVSLGIIVFVTMTSNAAFIAQLNAKWCLRFFYLSIIVNCIIILYTLF